MIIFLIKCYQFLFLWRPNSREFIRETNLIFDMHIQFGMIIRKLLNSSKLILLFLFTTSVLSAEPTPDAGKVTFKNYCSSCHVKDMKTAMTGPALANAEANWADYPREDLYNWIRNSQALISAGHPRAVELWNEYKPNVMNAFPNLSDEDIESVLLYINGVATGTYGTPVATAITAGAEGEEKTSNNYLYYLLFALLAFLSLILARVINNLNKISAVKRGETYESKSLRQTLTSRGFISFMLFGLIILGGYATANKAVDLGRQQGYAPDQPIKFSHETHAGINKIDCQYCHDSARRSKHAGIPATNTCMNCHSAVKVGSEYGTGELTKIYVSAGFDPAKGTYIEDYEELPMDSVERLYKNWIGDQYLLAEGLEEMDKNGEEHVSDQWAEITRSLTNDQKKDIRGPIEWTRIHNLPDHAYFNHSQHVSVGKLECQQCHGKVEEMEVLAQHAPLSMGWCINCHRETEVQFVGNEYYESYSKYHEELASGERDKVTVEDIGGLECQKCHY